MTTYTVADPPEPIPTPIVNLAASLTDHYMRHGPAGVHAASITLAALLHSLFAPLTYRCGIVADFLDTLHLDNTTPPDRIDGCTCIGVGNTGRHHRSCQRAMSHG